MPLISGRKYEKLNPPNVTMAIKMTIANRIGRLPAVYVCESKLVLAIKTSLNKILTTEVLHVEQDPSYQMLIQFSGSHSLHSRSSRASHYLFWRIW